MMKCVVSVVAFVLTLGCGAADPVAQAKDIVLIATSSGGSSTQRALFSEGDTWGGTGIGMEVKPTEVRIEYDCATGYIRNILSFDSSGQFKAEGIEFIGRGGPIRDEDVSAGETAQYTGKMVSKEQMTLSVYLSTSKITKGPYTLTRGGNPNVRLCL
jgi:hypothetical protein